MAKINFAEVVEEICEKDLRYSLDAYHFVQEGLNHTLKSLKRGGQHAHRHVSGQELLHGLREFALKEYGPMTEAVLNEWVSRQPIVWPGRLQSRQFRVLGKETKPIPPVTSRTSSLLTMPSSNPSCPVISRHPCARPPAPRPRSARRPARRKKRPVRCKRYFPGMLPGIPNILLVTFAG